MVAISGSEGRPNSLLEQPSLGQGVLAAVSPPNPICQDVALKRHSEMPLTQRGKSKPIAIDVSSLPARVDIWNVMSPHVGSGTPLSESPFGLRTPPKTPTDVSGNSTIEFCRFSR